MAIFRTLILVAVGLEAARAADHWAVLVAGSNGFWNYRHQADVCHAYQVLIKRGLKASNIIVMMYDDVANNSMNPFRGKLYNYPWPTMDDAVDVYTGCEIDYRGKDVSPDKFLAVLTGDSEGAGGRVLQSKADDHVFVNFVDHGGVGIIAFPSNMGVLHSNKIIDALKAMYAKKMYKQLTFYLETCESGSIFKGLLPESLPVYAVTAANASESSWGTFCGPDAKVGGKSIGSCLGDLFSVNWMMDTEESADKQETLREQYMRVKQLTNKSHVMQFGQVSTFDEELVSDFQGPGGNSLVGVFRNDQTDQSAVDARNVKLEHLYRRYVESRSAEAEVALVEEIKARRAVEILGSTIVKLALGSDGLVSNDLPGDFSWTVEMARCHEQAVEGFAAACGWDERRLPLAKTLYQLCDRTVGQAAPIVAAVDEACRARARGDGAELVV